MIHILVLILVIVTVILVIVTVIHKKNKKLSKVYIHYELVFSSFTNTTIYILAVTSP